MTSYMSVYTDEWKHNLCKIMLTTAHGCFRYAWNPWCANICICITSFRAPCPLQNVAYDVLFRSTARTHVRTCSGSGSMGLSLRTKTSSQKQELVPLNQIYDLIISLNNESETILKSQAWHFPATRVRSSKTIFFLIKKPSLLIKTAAITNLYSTLFGGNFHGNHARTGQSFGFKTAQGSS